MKLEDWREVVGKVNRDIEMLTRASATQKDVRRILRGNRARPTEEQLIDLGSFGFPPGEPRTVVIAGSEVKIWKIHRAGLNLSDVKGADLYYELGNKKFVLVQYKIPNSSGRVRLDDEQLDELQRSCPVECLPTTRFSCGSWYALHKNPTASYFPACEARELFGKFASRKSEHFINGLTHDQFQNDFGSCRIGARTKPVRASEYRKFSINSNRVVFRARNLDPAHKV